MLKTHITIVDPEWTHQWPVFENEQAIITNSNIKIPNTHNIARTGRSIPEPEPNDSILVIEPKCIIGQDYDIPTVNKYNKIFTWATRAFENTSVSNKIIEINLPSISHTDPKYLREHWIGWKDKTDEIIFIANNKTSDHPSELYSLRIKLADYLHKHSALKVSWYGYTYLPKPYYKGNLAGDKKIDTLRRAKFSVCCENSYDAIFSHNYFSEKLPDVCLAGTIPIYMGCYNIDEFNVPPYVDLRKYLKKNGHTHNVNFIGLLSEMFSYDENKYNDFLNQVFNNLNNSTGLHHICDMKRVYEKIARAFV